eukprot:NODE_1981_length_1545_cov_82.678622_g1886_i0.p1 GENE.NODE_1981_length_1545_cov_82.678622_g1886_i0~~NODE_1981_length_1545_cov_82.678622_g1886_i0.p1  ORF type:complete len:322 (+),score=28.63 NODE_1981_length_1545_cov_82.678622_g1886_i0:54-1019(+)
MPDPAPPKLLSIAIPDTFESDQALPAQRLSSSSTRPVSWLAPTTNSLRVPSSCGNPLYKGSRKEADTFVPAISVSSTNSSDGHDNTLCTSPLVSNLETTEEEGAYFESYTHEQDDLAARTQLWVEAEALSPTREEIPEPKSELDLEETSDSQGFTVSVPSFTSSRSAWTPSNSGGSRDSLSRDSQSGFRQSPLALAFDVPPVGTVVDRPTTRDKVPDPEGAAAAMREVYFASLRLPHHVRTTEYCKLLMRVEAAKAMLNGFRELPCTDIDTVISADGQMVFKAMIRDLKKLRKLRFAILATRSKMEYLFKRQSIPASSLTR